MAPAILVESTASEKLILLARWHFDKWLEFLAVLVT